MTQEEFIQVLDREDYSYEIEGDKIIVTHKWSVYLSGLTSLPPGVVFNNGGDVHLDRLTSLPPDVVFNNGGYVGLGSRTSLPPGVVFNNGGDVYLGYLMDRWFEDWKGNIKGIDSKRLFNVMIKQGVFI